MKKQPKDLRDRIADEDDPKILKELNRIHLERYGYDYQSVNASSLSKMYTRSIYESNGKIN